MSDLILPRPVIPKGLSRADYSRLVGAEPVEKRKAQKPSRPAHNVQAAIPKTDYLRSEEMMKAVRAFPCGNCGAINEGNCGAHPNWSWAGKGKSIKAHDLVATLCPSCHVPILDQGKDLTKEEREMMWLRAFYQTMLHGFQSGKFGVVE